MRKGKVKFYNIEKGFGFIFPDDNQEEIFFHKTELEKSGYQKLNTGDAVTFDVSTKKNGKVQAINIQLL